MTPSSTRVGALAVLGVSPRVVPLGASEFFEAAGAFSLAGSVPLAAAVSLGAVLSAEAFRVLAKVTRPPLDACFMMSSEPASASLGADPVALAGASVSGSAAEPPALDWALIPSWTLASFPLLFGAWLASGVLLVPGAVLASAWGARMGRDAVFGAFLSEPSVSCESIERGVAADGALGESEGVAVLKVFEADTIVIPATGSSAGTL